MSGFDVVLAVVSGVFGLFIGSFLNVLVYRIPNGEDFVHGRSHCPRCGHDLSALDLVPVFSYLALRRRCRYCRTPISGRYAFVELLTGGLFSASWILASAIDRWLALPLAAFCATAIVALFILHDGHKPPKVLYFLVGGFGAIVAAWTVVTW
jgi:leader peptidase (prepilin peptidase) / N-methyltransferase